MQGHIKRGSRWCLVRWKIPEESGRNGIITQYIIELSIANSNVQNITHKLEHPTFSSPDNVTHNLTNLTPYTKYKWKVAAATVNGTGPFSPTAGDFRTRQDGKFNLLRKYIPSLLILYSCSRIVRSYFVPYIYTNYVSLSTG